MDLSQRVGELSTEYRESISKERIDAFRAAIGAPAGDSAPPTFLTIFREGEFELMRSLGIALSSVVHGEQEYEYGPRTIQAGTSIAYQAKLLKALEKSGSSGKMTFLVLETTVTALDASGSAELVGTGRTTIVAREPAAKAQGGSSV